MFRSKGFTIAFTLLSLLIIALFAIFFYLIRQGLLRSAQHQGKGKKSLSARGFRRRLRG